MTNEELGTLAYTKSPKISRRTKFQDELQAAVSARASRVIMDQYSEDFNDDEDDFLNELLNSRKKKTDAFKASKTKTVNFEFSDDEDKPAASKRVSFLKTQRAPLEDQLTDDKNNEVPLGRSLDGDHSSLSSKHSTNSDHSSELRGHMEFPHSQDPQETTNRSVSPLSGDVLQDTPLLLQSDNQKDITMTAIPQKEFPTPKPRQKVMAMTNLPQDTQLKSQDSNISFAPTSESSYRHNTSSCSPNPSEGTHAALSSRSQSISSMGEHSVLTKSTVDSGSRNDLNSEDVDNRLSFEELTINQPLPALDTSVGQGDCPVNHESHTSDNLRHTLISAAHAKSFRVGSAKSVESKYLGSLRVLDHTFSLHDAEPQADSLRAAVYQEWVKKKKVTMKHNMEMRKKEELVKEKKKKEQEAKREDAIASYEAWKEKKSESLKVKTKEQQEEIKKEQQAREQKEEKRQASKQVFEKWKHEHDLILKEKYRKARKDETDQKLQKQEKEEERKKANHSAFTEWNEKKKNVLHERAIVKRKELKDSTEAERHLKEEKDKLALDMYESWLEKKTLEKKRHKEEKWFQGLLHDDSTPPPWSPPNKTIPRGK